MLKNMLSMNFVFLQVMIAAVDQGTPSLRSEKTFTLTVNVERNENTPEFTQNGIYEETIDETIREGSDVVKVEVEDEDSVVSVWNSRVII